MKFCTFVVLDLETTGLSFPKMTELAMIGIDRRHVQEHEGFPRILHKLLIAINPEKKIEPVAECISGISNEMVQNLPKFRKSDADLVSSFLHRLQPPLCIVAHNGNHFDFPLLAVELRQHAQEVLDIHCADTLKAFRSLFNVSSPPKPVPVHEELGNVEEDLLCISACENSQELKNFETSMQQINEVTPKSGSTAPIKNESYNKTNGINWEIEKVRRQLWKKVDNCDQNIIKVDRLSSYKLKDIYKHIMGCEMRSAHRAEDDALALLECIVKIAPSFFQWADDNAVLLSNMLPSK